MWVIIPALLLTAAVVQADEAVESPSEIAVTAGGVAFVSPDYATFQINISTTNKSAADAVRRTAEKRQRIVDALTGIGLAPEQILTMNYRVSPSWEYDDHRRPKKFLGYQAVHVVRIQVRKLTAVGRAVDAAVTAGATNVQDVNFMVESADSAEHAAFTTAVERAHERAATMARASGGSLGRLIELTTREAARAVHRNVVDAIAVSDQMAVIGTHIGPARKRISVTVLGRWEFVASSGSVDSPRD